MADHKTFFYSARCLICLKKFQVPKLSDFRFGEYLFSTIDGKEYANYSVTEELDISELIDDKLKQNTLGKNLNEIQKNRLKYRLIGKISDQSESKEFIEGKYVCPRCGSKVVHLNEKQRIRAERIPKLNFEKFKSLSKQERDDLIQGKIDSELN